MCEQRKTNYNVEYEPFNKFWRKMQISSFTTFSGEYYWAFSEEFQKFQKLLQKGSQDQVWTPGGSIHLFNCFSFTFLVNFGQILDSNTYIVQYVEDKPWLKYQSHRTIFSWGSTHFSHQFYHFLVKFGRILDRNTYIV